MTHYHYRLGLDLGTNSIGWTVVALTEQNEPYQLVRTGARIYSDGRNPKDGSSLAVERRGPRQMRRRRDRYLRRREWFMHLLIRFGLMPDDTITRKALQLANPYELRARGLHEKLQLPELGRALFHLNQRRGFKSNRKTGKKDEQESGKIKSAIQNFQKVMRENEAETVGEALWRRLQDGAPVRARLLGEGAKATYALYIDRAMIEHEFDTLWDRQQAWYPQILSEAARQKLKNVLFHQRPLKPVLPGKCTLNPNERRTPLALPSAQLFRLLQELNHLRLVEKVTGEIRALKRHERDTLFDYLKTRKEANFDGLRKQLFGANAEAFYFTVELEKRGERKKLLGNDTGAKLAHKQAFGKAWDGFSLTEQDALVEKLLAEEDETTLVAWLQAQYELSPEQAQHISNINLSDDHLRFGRTAVGRVLPHLRDGWDDKDNQPLTYDKAVKAAGYADHRALQGDGSLPALPYYGEILWRYTLDASSAQNKDEKQYGKIGNPTVHIGLNQLRKLINALIKKYGKPAEIHVELARDLKANREQKEAMNKQNKEGRERNEKLNRELESLGQKPNAENRLRLRLFQELGEGKALSRQCIYSGLPMAMNKLFTDEYEIDHILPFSQTFDDSYNNKLLVHRKTNRKKSNQTPFDAFKNDQWDDILARAQALPYPKRKRFAETTLQDWQGDNDFLARQLNDTAYFARVTREYLAGICPPNKIVTLPGRLTALLRGKWGLNHILFTSGSKERTDHRHHAIDAVVIALTDRSLLNRVSKTTARAREENLERLFGDFPKPWETLYGDVDQAIRRCVVSHKPDHGAEAGLHNETAYGIVSGPDDKGIYRVRHRIPLSGVTAKNLPQIRCDAHFRTLLEQACAGDDEKAHKQALHELAEKTRQRKVWLEEPMSVVTILPHGPDKRPIPDRAPYKAYKGDSNYCYELFVDEKGRWDGVVISTFLANQKAYKAFAKDLERFRSRTFDGKPLLMRLMRNDLVAIEENDEDGKIRRRIMRVAVLSNGIITLAEHFEANVDSRNRDKTSGFKYTYKTPGSLQKTRGRRVFVDLLGNVLDPGFPVRPAKASATGNDQP